MKPEINERLAIAHGKIGDIIKDATPVANKIQDIIRHETNFTSMAALTTLLGYANLAMEEFQKKEGLVVTDAAKLERVIVVGHILQLPPSGILAVCSAALFKMLLALKEAQEHEDALTAPTTKELQ
jgi:hypothetical protein